MDTSLRATDPDLADLIERRLSVSARDADHLIELMTRVADLATEHISGADQAGITVELDDDAPMTIAPTDHRVQRFDNSQYEHDNGPCLQATRTDRVIDIGIAEMRELWPDLAAVSEQCGIGRVLAAPLHRRSIAVGSLNLYTDAATVTSISADSPVLVVLLDHLDRALDVYSNYSAVAEHAHALRGALEGRTIIDNALGMISELEQCSFDAAVEILDRKARIENVPRRAAADSVVAHRTI
ncbi:MAG: ANTAR domain-containing protein [Rhodococcus sp. (in: high G+C Gram-positive bacteria)]